MKQFITILKCHVSFQTEVGSMYRGWRPDEAAVARSDLRPPMTMASDQPPPPASGVKAEPASSSSEFKPIQPDPIYAPVRQRWVIKQNYFVMLETLARHHLSVRRGGEERRGETQTGSWMFNYGRGNREKARHCINYKTASELTSERNWWKVGFSGKFLWQFHQFPELLLSSRVSSNQNTAFAASIDKVFTSIPMDWMSWWNIPNVPPLSSVHLLGN